MQEKGNAELFSHLGDDKSIIATWVCLSRGLLGMGAACKACLQTQEGGRRKIKPQSKSGALPGPRVKGAGCDGWTRVPFDETSLEV